jgi:hypothetical protein
MKFERKPEKLSNLDIAHRQIERAIVIFLDDRDYISALTLAGAAEEILGKLLNREGKSHWLDEISSGALELLGFSKDEQDTTDAKQAKKEIAHLANFYKNRCKHINAEEHMNFVTDEKAAEMIDRAISNYFALTNRETGAMGRFKELVLWPNRK